MSVRSGHSRPAVLAEAGADLSSNLLALNYLAAYWETFSSPASGQHVDYKIDAGQVWAAKPPLPAACVLPDLDFLSH